MWFLHYPILCIFLVLYGDPEVTRGSSRLLGTLFQELLTLFTSKNKGDYCFATFLSTISPRFLTVNLVFFHHIVNIYFLPNTSLPSRYDMSITVRYRAWNCPYFSRQRNVYNVYSIRSAPNSNVLEFHHNFTTRLYPVKGDYIQTHWFVIDDLRHTCEQLSHIRDSDFWNEM